MRKKKRNQNPAKIQQKFNLLAAKLIDHIQREMGRVRQLEDEKRKLDNLDFARHARAHGIDAVEYVNAFFTAKAEDQKYLAVWCFLNIFQKRQKARLL